METNPKISNDILLAAKWHMSRILPLLGKKNEAKELANFIKARHDERFFRPIKILIKAKRNEQGYGFAIMAICCLLIETIQSYRDGLPTTDKRELGQLRKLGKDIPLQFKIPDGLTVEGKKTFKKFFKQYGNYFPGINGTEFYKSVRCGLLHQGQTKNSFIFKKKMTTIYNPITRVINRDLFVKSMEHAFNDYVGELSKKDWNDPLWENARRKIWWLIRLS